MPEVLLAVVVVAQRTVVAVVGAFCSTERRGRPSTTVR